MLKDQCVSVTDLRTKTKQCLKEAEKEPKYIFINNKPVAVIININIYEEYFSKPDLIELEQNEVTSKLKQEAEKSKKTSKKDLLDIQ
jgi:PHD/YefM family antitoxin component YafN of YafNO toxin-antitoxin module